MPVGRAYPDDFADERPRGYRGRHEPDLPPEVLDMLVLSYVAVAHGDAYTGEQWETKALKALLFTHNRSTATAVEALRGGRKKAQQLAAQQVRQFSEQLTALAGGA